MENSELKEVNLSSIHLFSWVICKSNKKANKEITFICSLVTWQKQLKDGMFAQFEVSSLSRYIKHVSKIRSHIYSLSRCLKDTCRCLICFLQFIPYSIASHSLILTTLRDNLPTSPKSVRKLPHRPTQSFFFHSYVPSDCYSRLAIMIPFIANWTQAHCFSS